MAYWQDDTFDTWPEVYKAGTAAIGLYSRCGVYCARELTDGHIPAELAASYGTREWVQKLVEVGLWEIEATGYRDVYFLRGKKGNRLNPTRLEALKKLKQAARRQALVRDPELREAVRERDRDGCRYCGIKVRWNDRKGSAGGTYDHVDPDGPNTFENLVVACRGCNSSKKDRTPEEAGMALLPPPGAARAASRYNPDEIQNASGTNQVSSRPPSLPPSKEGKGERAPATPGAAHALPEDPRVIAEEDERLRLEAEAAVTAIAEHQQRTARGAAIARAAIRPAPSMRQRGSGLAALDAALADMAPTAEPSHPPPEEPLATVLPIRRAAEAGTRHQEQGS